MAGLVAGLCRCHSAWQRALGVLRRAAGPGRPGRREVGRGLPRGTLFIDHGAGNGLTRNCLLVCEMSLKAPVWSSYGVFLQNLSAPNLISSALSFSLVHHPSPLQISPGLPSLLVSVCLKSSHHNSPQFKPCGLPVFGMFVLAFKH